LFIDAEYYFAKEVLAFFKNSLIVIYPSVGIRVYFFPLCYSQLCVLLVAIQVPEKIINKR